MREREVAAAKPVPGKESTYLWDDKVRGLALRVREGSKTFFLKAKIKGRTRWIRIGRWGEITLTQARKVARQKLAEIAIGDDPTAARRKRDTLASVVQVWEGKEAQRLKPSTRSAYRRAFRDHWLPELGSRSMTTISRGDVERVHARLSAEQLTGANRALAALSSVWNHAEQWGMAPTGSNPCRGVRRNKEVSRDRFLSPHELQRLFKVLKSEDRGWADIIRLILLTGMRKAEALGLRWENIDWEGSRIRLTDSKTGARTLPLSESALTLLRSRHSEAEGSALVFPSSRTGGIRKGMQKWWNQVRSRAGLWDLRIHDLRHTMATAALEAGHSLDSIGTVLGHSNMRTTSIYTHVRANTARAVANDAADQMQRWEEEA